MRDSMKKHSKIELMQSFQAFFSVLLHIHGPVVLVFFFVCISKNREFKEINITRDPSPAHRFASE